MVTVKMLRPYYIKINSSTLRIVLAYQYFSVFISGKVYQFIPVEASEIRVDLDSKKIENVEARFAFQKGKDIVYLTMIELMALPEFHELIHSICTPYYEDFNHDEGGFDDVNIDDVFSELEQMNVRRLIDKALDENDYQSFKELVQLL